MCHLHTASRDSIGCHSARWVCPRLGIKGVRRSHSSVPRKGGGGGYREPREAGVVVTSMQHTWQRQSK